MCGLAGIVGRGSVDRARLDRSHVLQAHRGPDARITRWQEQGCWQVGLAHQRLSIIDLSPEGNQPFELEGDWIIYNGEVYNYVELRAELESLGVRFRTQTDTEVILAALRHWGIEGALNRFNGMWAFAWYDVNARRMVLARDRAGVKPLNYFIHDETLYFASELKTVLDLSPVKFELNEQAIGEYLVQSLIETSAYTCFKGLMRLPAGNYGIVDLTQSRMNLTLHRYWTAPSQPVAEVKPEELIEQVRALFIDSVRLRLRSDVPVGVLLSGGLDSSSIAAAVHGLNGSEGDLHLFSAVSKDPRFDESPFIDRMAAHLKCPVYKVELDLDPESASRYLSEVTWHNDEPIGGFANVAHYLLMREANELGIKVILSGQGADEILCGYRKFLGFYLQSLVRDGYPFKAAGVAASFIRQGTIIRQFQLGDAKRYMPAFLRNWEIDVAGEALRSFEPLQLGLNGHSLQERQKADFDRFSIPVLTHYEDRMSMAWSREIRVPFLDYRLVELLLPLDGRWKLHGGWTKYVLRKAMEPLLPPEITWRKDKQGFTNPEGEWLKHQLSDFVQQYLREDREIYRRRLVDRDKFAALYELYRRQPAENGRYAFKDVFNPIALEVFLERFGSYLA